MFNIEFLHVIREFEYKKITAHFPPGARILEIGGGTGYQARRLSEDGYLVESIDIPDSNYAQQLEFKVLPYDGKNIPFPEHAFDVIFSSNVLEHVVDLPYLQSEMKRVLKPGGYCVHLMPTGSWRLWTNVAHYTELLQRQLIALPRLVPRRVSRKSLVDVLNVARLMASLFKQYAIVPRHGEKGNALTEIVTFGSLCWKKHFRAQGFDLVNVAPTGLFYTGHMVAGARLSLENRQKLAGLLGSACIIYIVKPGMTTKA